MSKFKIGDRVRFNHPDHPTYPVYYGTIIEPDTTEDNVWWIKWDGNDTSQCCEEKRMVLITEESSKTKSDGGSSDYYKLNINGNPVEVEEVIYALVGGDFILGNILKACRRMHLDSKGQGKEGIDMEYDKNKIVYFANSYVKRFGGK